MRTSDHGPWLETNIFFDVHHFAQLSILTKKHYKKHYIPIICTLVPVENSLIIGLSSRVKPAEMTMSSAAEIGRAGNYTCPSDVPVTQRDRLVLINALK